MTQVERGRLVALKNAKKKLISQKQAAAGIGVTERQVRRLVRQLRGRASNRRLPAELEQRAITILSDPLYPGFGPTLAAEYLHKQHQITLSKETLKQWRRRRHCGESVVARWWKYISGGRGGVAVANWCSGIPALTTGWKAVGNGFI